MYWKLVELFFGDESLQTSLHIMIMCIQSKNVDAVVYTCSSAIRNAVSFCFTDDGIVPFPSTPDLVIPFDFMSRAQLQYSLEYCMKVEEGGMYLSGTKMGRGFFVKSIDRDRHYISHSQILAKTHNLLRQMKTSPHIVHMIMHQVTGECTSSGVEENKCAGTAHELHN